MILVTRFFRGAIVENFHIGYAVVIDDKGDIIFFAGDPEYPTYIRSAAKPFQVVPLLESGAVEKFKFTDEEIAIMCASHNGESYHVEIVSGILRKIGMGIENLLCGSHVPLDKTSYEQMILKGRRVTALHNNCSGKHAGMLALSRIMEVSTDNYVDPNHPIQRMILEKIKFYSEKEKIPVAVDGCNAPTFFLPLKNIALMYRKLIEGADEYLTRILHIVSLHPKLIAGRGCFDTDFISAMSGKGITKKGADGIRGIGIRAEEGRSFGIALKVLSGNSRASDSMAVAILKYLRLLDEETLAKFDSYHCPVLKNYADREEGRIETEIVQK